MRPTEPECFRWRSLRLISATVVSRPRGRPLSTRFALVGRRGWQARYRYQSHALRFEVKRPLEEVDEFRKRINQLALAEGEQRPESSDDGWFFGARAREHGSVHSDYWSGTAAALAARGAIGIHPRYLDAGRAADRRPDRNRGLRAVPPGQGHAGLVAAVEPFLAAP